MSMFRAATITITTVLNTITKAASTVDKSIDIGYNYVDKQHVRQTLLQTKQIQKDTARDLREITKELDEDVDLKRQFDALDSLFNVPSVTEE